jgi:hypothetical protein
VSFNEGGNLSYSERNEAKELPDELAAKVYRGSMEWF